MEEIFFLFGGSRENKRAERLVDCWEANGGTGTFYVTGYPKDTAGEVESMVAYLIERGVPRKCIRIAGSYETLSNVESCIDVLRNHDCIYASTGPLHWLRFQWIFFMYYPELRGKISFIPSGEEEQWVYAITLLVAYVIFTPKGWQKITQFLRKEEYELCKNPEVIEEIARKYGVGLIGHERCKQVELNIVWLAFLFRSLLKFLLKILVNKKVPKNLTKLKILYIIRYQKLFLFCKLLKMAGEKVLENEYEGMSLEALEAEDAALEEEVAKLEAKRAALHTQLEIAKSNRGSTPESTRSASSRIAGLDLSRMAVANVSRAHVDRLKLYKWGNESITKQEVLNIVNGLPEPYNSEVSRYIERNNIRGLQEYLNDKIDSGEIDLDGLTRALNVRNIPFTDGHILEDDKFGPQTLETIRFLIRQLNGEPEEPGYSEINVRVEIKLPAQGDVRPEDLVELPEGGTAEFEDGRGIDKEKAGKQEVVVLVRVGGKVERVTVVVVVDVESQTARVEKKREDKEDKNPDKSDRLSDQVEKEPNLDWIKEEMSAAMHDIKDKNPKKNRSPERNSYDKNFDIDMARNRVILKTWGISLRSSEKEPIDDNRCEIDWKTGDMFIVYGKNQYKMPLHFGRFALDKGYPTGDNDNNRQKIRAFTEVGNLMNMLKAHAVFNGKGAIEYQDSSFVGRAMYLPFVGEDGIHLNDGVIGGASDTLLISEGELNRLSNAYSHLGLKFDKVTKIQIASLLTAMKLDLGKIKWNPDIERVGVDPLDDEHKRWVKHYSKKYNRGSA